MTYFTCCGAHNFYGTPPWVNTRTSTSNGSISANIIGNLKSDTGTVTDASAGCIPPPPPLLENRNLYSNWTPATLWPPPPPPCCFICPCHFYHQQMTGTSTGKDNNQSIHCQTELSLLNPNANTELFLLEEMESKEKKPYRYLDRSSSLNAPRDCQYLAEKIKLSFQEIEALKIRQRENKDSISSGSEPEMEDTYVFGISDSPLFTSSNRDPRERRKNKISLNQAPSYKILPKRHVSKVSINYFFDENGLDVLRRREGLKSRDTPEPEPEQDNIRD